VAVAREQPQQAQADLAMAADHQHLHGRQCTEAPPPASATGVGGPPPVIRTTPGRRRRGR
jgi:hypothetical protein